MAEDGNQPIGAGVTRIEIGPEAVSQAVAAAQAFAQEAGCGPKTAARLAIIAEEMAYNLVDHSGMRAGDCLEIGMVAQDQDILITLGDCGAPFDPRHAPSIATRPAEQVGGVGIAMVLAWAEVVDYAREGTRNRLTLRMRAPD